MFESNSTALQQASTLWQGSCGKDRAARIVRQGSCGKDRAAKLARQSSTALGSFNRYQLVATSLIGWADFC